MCDAKKKRSKGGDLPQKTDEIACDEGALIGAAEEIDKRIKAGKMKTVSEKELWGRAETVESGYDEIAEAYLKTKNDDTLAFARELEAHLKPSSRILDAGCGTGVPIARYLSSKYEVQGIDISSRQIELARKLVPDAQFKKADMLEPGFENGTFDGIICIYALIHVDREKHLEILKKFYDLLKPPGYLLVCMQLEEYEGEGEYLGTKMFWSGYGRKRNLEFLKKCGFSIIWEKDWANPKDSNDRHLFVLCRK